MVRRNVQHANLNADDVEQEFRQMIEIQVMIIAITILCPLTALYWPISGIFAAAAFTITEGAYLFYLHYGSSPPTQDDPIPMQPILEKDDTSSVSGDSVILENVNGGFNLEDGDRGFNLEDGDGGFDFEVDDQDRTNALRGNNPLSLSGIDGDAADCVEISTGPSSAASSVIGQDD
ncbi:MAG: hypothetical protein P0S94_05330 [Simkaniaceae bacterium]|nr:hypothetical protein [Simkaniaceae bacterium]